MANDATETELYEKAKDIKVHDKAKYLRDRIEIRIKRIEVDLSSLKMDFGELMDGFVKTK